MERREFKRQFKLEAVKLVVERVVGFAQAARDQDLHVAILRRGKPDSLLHYSDQGSHQREDQYKSAIEPS